MVDASDAAGSAITKRFARKSESVPQVAKIGLSGSDFVVPTLQIQDVSEDRTETCRIKQTPKGFRPFLASIPTKCAQLNGDRVI